MADKPTHTLRTGEQIPPLEPWGPGSDLSVVGRRRPRIDGEAKVSGRATYAYDVRLPRMLYARVLRSPHPHAHIRSIDTSAAAALPGVLAVVSSADTSRIPWYDTSAVFDTTVRFVGDEVAAVAAVSEEIAEDALRLIEVDYQPLPFVTNLAAALMPGAPTIWPDGNRAETKEYSRGDVDAGLAEAEVTIDEEYTTQTAIHNAMEPHGCTVQWEGDHLTIWESTQSIFAVRQGVADALGLPHDRVRVIKQYMGGGFGAKQIAWKHTVIAALLAQRAGRPVQLMLDREAETLAVGNRNATRQRVRLGATRDGRLTAIDAGIEQESGAYLVGGEGSMVSGPYQRLYRCPNVHTAQTPVFTNLGPAVAFRAPGFVEGAFALESALDELARALDMDPLELRLRNYAEQDQSSDKPYSAPEGLRQCYERGASSFGWRERTSDKQNDIRRRGVGMAAHDWGGSGWPPAYAWVRVNGDGTVDAITGTQDIGTGTRTGLTAIVAEELGVPMEQITFYLGDTARGPYAPVSSGSATQATIGPALREAAAAAKAQLLEAAVETLEAPADRLTIADGVIFERDNPANRVPVAEVTKPMAPAMVQGFGARGPNPEDRSVRTFGAQFAEVEVDTETGEVTVLRIVASHDCGRVVNPTMVESQIVGGITQGIGFGLLEGRVVDGGSGVVLNAGLEEYKVPTVADIPTFDATAVDLPDPAANPTAAKGIGEPPLIPTAPAIVNAIFDATGVRLRQLPVTRARLLEALAEQRANGSDA